MRPLPSCSARYPSSPLRAFRCESFRHLLSSRSRAPAKHPQHHHPLYTWGSEEPSRRRNANILARIHILTVLDSDGLNLKYLRDEPRHHSFWCYPIEPLKSRHNFSRSLLVRKPLLQRLYSSRKTIAEPVKIERFIPVAILWAWTKISVICSTIRRNSWRAVIKKWRRFFAASFI